MEMPEIIRLGRTLPAGWQQPTPGLVRAHLLNMREGLAPPSARHLYQHAEPITEEDALGDPTILGGIDLLRSYVDPRSSSTISAVGMAYPQLARASGRNVRILTANKGMPDLMATSRQPEFALLFDPAVVPVESEGSQDRLEYCFSAPGLGVVIPRWNVVELRVEGQEPVRVDGTYAWILQHEADHFDGILCVSRALDQGLPIYFVPPELKPAFLARLDDRGEWPYMFLAEQWMAMKTGEYDPGAYAQFML